MDHRLGNLYWVFSYAWEHVPAGDLTELGRDRAPDVPNLLARLLLDGARRLIRRGLDRGYVAHVEETRSPAGRILLDQVIKHQTLRRGAVVVEHEELTADVLHNRLLKATARQLATARNISPANEHDLQLLVRRLGEVTDISLTTAPFRRVHLTRNSAEYVPVMRLCELVSRQLIPDSAGQGCHFADLLQDEAAMNKIFERFLFNFYRLHAPQFRAASEVLAWPASGSTADLAYLPQMRTDVTLRSLERTIVLDAKYYAEPFKGRFGSPKVNSGHLYQLSSYLRHTEPKRPGGAVDGALIYPANGPGVRLAYEINGHAIQVVAVDFRRSWTDVHQGLLSIVADTPS